MSDSSEERWTSLDRFVAAFGTEKAKKVEKYALAQPHGEWKPWFDEAVDTVLNRMRPNRDRLNRLNATGLVRTHPPYCQCRYLLT